MDECREAFEAWQTRVLLSVNLDVFNPPKIWDIWQAAWKEAQSYKHSEGES